MDVAKRRYVEVVIDPAKLLNYIRAESLSDGYTLTDFEIFEVITLFQEFCRKSVGGEIV